MLSIEFKVNTTKIGFKNLTSKEYPGRIIILGKDKSGKNLIVLYAITGRSPSSQARKIVYEKGGIWIKPTDEKILKKGNIDLLIYPAVLLSNKIAISNGKQTADIKKALHSSQNAVETLASSLKDWDYEPDSPTYTPRISGCIFSPKSAALSIIKRAKNGASRRFYYDISLTAGTGKMIMTYSGENKDPVPSFSGDPLDIELMERTPGKTAEAVYEALSSKAGNNDFRVGLACIFIKDLKNKIFDISIINRYEREKESHE